MSLHQRALKALKEVWRAMSVIRAIPVRRIRISGQYAAFLCTSLALIVFQRVTVHAEVKQLEQGILLTSSQEAAAIVNSVNPYTPYLGESPNSVATHYISEESIASAVPVDASDRADAPVAYTTYVVQKGDTVSSVAQKFDLHVASIQEANGLSNDQVNGLTPGQELKVASKDISTSQDWLVALNKKKEEERRAREKRLALATSASRRVVTRERIDDPGQGSGDTNFVFPLSGGFNGVSRRLTRSHDGVDYRADMNSSVKAISGGTVIEITGGWGSGFGKSVVISHGGGYTSRYAHLNQVYVGIGQTVGQGEVIGASGNTGNSTGPHLHLQTERNGRPFDPGI